MSWFNVWTGLKNKTCRYLLQRYLGQFLEEKLNLEQLKVDLYNGKATVRNVSLKIEALNELFEAQGWALEVISGHIGLLTVTVPWNALLTNDSSIEVSDSFISLRPVQRQNDGTSMLESMWSSVSSSMQLAEECMKQKDDDSDDVPETNTNSIPGLEKFAETIDNVLNRIKASFTNTVIRLEYPCKENRKGICLYFNIDNFTYKNETGCEKLLRQPRVEKEEEMCENKFSSKFTTIDNSTERTYLMPMFAKHNISINGLRISTEEFKLQSADNPQISDLTIPILEIYEQQNIQIKMKQSEDISGPKVIIDAEIGSVFALLTPRQIHLLLKLWNAFQEDHTDFTTASQSKECGDKKLKSHIAGILQKPGNWLNYEDNIVIQSLPKTLRREDVTENFNKYCDSLNTSISSSTTINNSVKLRRKSTNLESSGEILNFSVSVASFVCLILHEDVLVENNINVNDSPLNEASQREMNRIAKTFFSHSRTIFQENMEASKLAEGKNRVYIYILPVFAEGTQQRNKNILSSKIKFIATKLDVCEILDGKTTELITFDRLENFNVGCPKRPEIIINMKSDSTSLTAIEITLEKCQLELDISICDRLSAMLGPSPFTLKSYPVVEDKKGRVTAGSIVANILSNCLSIKLRFPIVDARPIHNPNRVPWWKQNIRDDYLLFIFNMISIKYAANTFELIANEIDVQYVDNKMDSIINLMKVLMSQNQEPNRQFDYPKLSIMMCDNLSLQPISLDPAENRGYSDFQTNSVEWSLPFSSKHACRESDTLHNKQDTEESETILLPGEREEINKFCSQTMGNSKLQIEINLPKVDLNLKSKQVYEVIYNRLNTDLLMWEPSSPFIKTSTRSQVPSTFTQSKENYYDINLQSNTKNKIYFSDSEESDTSICNESNESSKFYSTYHIPISQENSNIVNDQFSECSIKIHIGSGSLEALVPVRNKENIILPELSGKFVFEVTELNIFTVNGYKKNKDLCYICLQIGGIEMSHCGAINDASTPTEASKQTHGLQSTLYKSPKGLTKSNNMESKERERVTLVIEIRKNLEKKIKRIKITTGIQQMTLRYQPVLSANFWLNQLIDFLDVCDYPIEGYEPFGVITEFQLHLWDCSVDYRPKDIEYRAVLEIGTFAISSNIISTVTGCNLRFVVEECVLSIAPYGKSKIEPDNFKDTEMDSKHLVSVLDIGLLDISLRLSEKPTKKCPKFDLRCSVHDAHLRTCCDSGKALAQIIAHIACDDDSFQYDNETINVNQPQQTTSSELEKSFYNMIESESEQQERINIMMAEAVQETVTLNSSEFEHSMYSSNSTETFYFPDENKGFLNKQESELNDSAEISEILNFERDVMSTSYSITSDPGDALPQIKTELGNVPTNNEQHEIQNDEYCVIAEDEKYFMSQCGIKNLTICDDPLRIVDNHFCVPTNKIDLLKPPDNFPMAVLRYTLCEMTFTWHLYGGTDFLESFAEHDDKKKTKDTSMSHTYKHGVSYSRGADNIHPGKKPKDLTWKSIGGPHRNHEVLVEIQLTKVRLSHEVYPTETVYASRQVLLIQEIEIRDRLQTSDINKFLYYPSMINVSHKSPHHMVVLKALHVRPNPAQTSSQECSLRISLLPMRLHIDQDTLIFLADYFMNNDEFGKESQNLDAESASYKPIQAPIMAVEVPEAVYDLNARKAVSKNLDILMDDENQIDSQKKSSSEKQPIKDDDAPIYFREVIFSPEVPIRFDYHGRRIELSRGPITGLLMGLGQLQCSEIRLRKIVYRRGLLGVDKLIAYLCKEWLKDIKRNQLQKILKGVGPAYSLVQFIQGVFDLFRLPIEQYQRDGRIIKGLQLGAQSFTARTALAALEITSRIIQLLQFTAETAFDMVSPGPSIKRTRKSRMCKKKKRPQRPKDVREGVTNAYLIVKEGINDSAATLIETAVAEHDQKGYTGAVGAVMRQIPQLVVCPAVLATQATTNILGGVKSSLVPEAKMEAREKWKHESD